MSVFFETLSKIIKRDSRLEQEDINALGGMVPNFRRLEIAELFSRAEILFPWLFCRINGVHAACHGKDEYGNPQKHYLSENTRTHSLYSMEAKLTSTEDIAYVRGTEKSGCETYYSENRVPEEGKTRVDMRYCHTTLKLKYERDRLVMVKFATFDFEQRWYLESPENMTLTATKTT